MLLRTGTASIVFFFFFFCFDVAFQYLVLDVRSIVHVQQKPPI